MRVPAERGNDRVHVAGLITPLSPFADGFVADAIALGDDARGLGRSRDLDAHRGGWFAPVGGSASSQHLIANRDKPPRVVRDSPAYLIPMTFRNQTASANATVILGLFRPQCRKKLVGVIPDHALIAGRGTTRAGVKGAADLHAGFSRDLLQ